MFEFLKNRHLDDNLLEDIESTLIQADIGITITDNIIQQLENKKFNKSTTVKELSQYIKEILKKQKILADPPKLSIASKPTVIMLFGVNGAGKTTSLAKLGFLLAQQIPKPKISLVPCDTFRAGAYEQLKQWSINLELDFFDDNHMKDPAALAYKALEHAQQDNTDILLIDTSGRLHNNENLMNQLSKTTKVLKKLKSEAPHYNFLVVDGTTGQNAIWQTKIFLEFIDITGLIVTKLDSHSKAGFILQISEAVNLPIYFTTHGEAKKDLQYFNSENYLNSLLSL